MKKLLMICAACLLVLTGCKKNKENKEPYTQIQQDAFTMFYGTYQDNMHGLQDHDRIIFGEHYSEPVSMSSYETHGELIWKEWTFVNHEFQYVDTDYYYNLSDDAGTLTLYRKSDGSRYKAYPFTYNPDVKTFFYLRDSSLTLPYCFQKVEE